ncbi:hypothetical protein G7054_g9417 [Neopestalotiopsis clavispora]|nr:hypothetical protein G7054_g9417 [Neopestalotiopsis clavispora]
MATKTLSLDPYLGEQLAKLLSSGEIRSRIPNTVEDVSTPHVLHEEHMITGPDNNQIAVSVFRRKTPLSAGKCIGLYHLHGGGMISGNRFITVGWALSQMEERNVVIVSVDYRLAPMHPDPAPLEDCYAGLVWMAAHAGELNIDPAKIIIQGTSAGGGLAAGVALLSRDRGGPAIAGQMLLQPMLDDRDETVSSRQFEGVGIWDRRQNNAAWTALLGERRGTENVSPYSAPARAQDLTKLAPTFIEVGSVETFRDEAVAYAQHLWRDGVQCELHVWPGAFHGSDMICPEAALSIAASKRRQDWFQRLTAQLDES